MIDFAKPEYPDVSAVILAGGVSRRLGRDKAVEPFAGEALIRRVAGRMRSVAERVVVVVNDERRAVALGGVLPDSVAFAADEYPDKGSLGGLFTGLNAAGTEWAIFCACDMPFVNPEVYRLLLSKRDDGVDAVVPVVDGRPEPVHAAYSRRCLEAMRDKILANRLKIAGFFEDVSVRYVEESEIRERDPRLLSFFNINTEDDLRTALRLADENRADGAFASVVVELFGGARLVSGKGEVAARLPSWANSDDVAAALAAAVPSLVGVAVSEDGRALLPSYVANLNGAAFIETERAAIADGDRVYLFSSQAGG